MIPELDARELTQRLDSLRAPGRGAVIAFDGDGTLWSGDVAEDVFSHAIEHDLLRADAAEELARAAAAFGVRTGGSPSEIARDIFAAYLRGHYPEREVCEVMTWCFAGYSLEELSQLADRVLAGTNLPMRLHRELDPVFAWARERGVRTLVISASPRPIVERAARHWGIAASDIAASTPALDGERISTRMHTPVPYAETKVSFGRALVGDADWLAAFGDSGFDGDMLCAARQAVAVRPKPSLAERAAAIPGLVALRP